MSPARGVTDAAPESLASIDPGLGVAFDHLLGANGACPDPGRPPARWATSTQPMPTRRSTAALRFNRQFVCLGKRITPPFNFGHTDHVGRDRPSRCGIGMLAWRAVSLSQEIHNILLMNFIVLSHTVALLNNPNAIRLVALTAATAYVFFYLIHYIANVSSANWIKTLLSSHRCTASSSSHSGRSLLWRSDRNVRCSLWRFFCERVNLLCQPRSFL